MLISTRTMRVITWGAAGVAVFVLLLVAVVYGLSYRASHPSVKHYECGDATLLDKGIVSHYPRLELAFPLISFEPGSVEFEVQGCALPAPLEMWLVVESDATAPGSSKPEIRALEANVSYTVSDMKGSQRQFSYSGVLGDSWASEAIGDLSYFSQKGQRFRLDSQHEARFRVEISVDTSKEVSTGARLRPMLVGGGFEK